MSDTAADLFDPEDDRTWSKEARERHMARMSFRARHSHPNDPENEYEDRDEIIKEGD